MPLNSFLYFGTVFHRRIRPISHLLRYKVYTFLFDLDEIQDLDKRFKIFGYNKWSLISFYDRDHGPLTDKPLRNWVETRMREGGVKPDGGPIRLLCYPRILGYVFNPISVFYCYSHDGNLSAILYEVCNTFKERHTYVIPVKNNQDRIIKQSCKKALYVSPFLDMDAEYDFRLKTPGSNLSVVIHQKDKEGVNVTAIFVGRRVDFQMKSLLHSFFDVPFLTLKIIFGIHFEAVILWLKGCPIFKHVPASASVQSSVGQCKVIDPKELNI